MARALYEKLKPRGKVDFVLVKAVGDPTMLSLPKLLYSDLKEDPEVGTLLQFVKGKLLEVTDAFKAEPYKTYLRIISNIVKKLWPTRQRQHSSEELQRIMGQPCFKNYIRSWLRALDQIQASKDSPEKDFLIYQQLLGFSASVVSDWTVDPNVIVNPHTRMVTGVKSHREWLMYKDPTCNARISEEGFAGLPPEQQQQIRQYNAQRHIPDPDYRRPSQRAEEAEPATALPFSGLWAGRRRKTKKRKNKRRKTKKRA